VTRIAPTLTADQASAGTWDAVVIGAGPAGAYTALGLARAGLATLLVDRKAFPRHKVCGGCLNARAVAWLEHAGVAAHLWASGARALSSICLQHGRRRAVLSLPPGMAVSRATLDAALLRAAILANCAFLPETSALVESAIDRVGSGRGEARWVSLALRDGQRARIGARVVVVADGLGHSSLRDATSMQSVVASDARVGVGAVGHAGCVGSEPGRITMAVSDHGYVGVTAVENDLVNVAAALDVGYLKACGSPAAAVRAVLASAGVSASASLDRFDWQGTLPLTRRLLSPVAPGMFVLGDAAGYIEPFTGEGMAWALAAADAVVPLAICASRGWSADIADQWRRTYDTLVRQEQSWCRGLARGLRHPRLVAFVVASLSRQPGLARPFLWRGSPGTAAHSIGERR